MNISVFRYTALSFCIGAVLSAQAAVSPEQAAQLGAKLTPIGAERAGNAAGTIPEWTGGLAVNAGKVDERGFLEDPYANDKPLFVITAQNVEQYKDQLSEGQVAMFKRYPDSFKMPIYPSRRSAALPEEIYAKIKIVP